MDRELATTFGLYPCSGFWETWVYRYMDGRLRHDSSSADTVNQI